MRTSGYYPAEGDGYGIHADVSLAMSETVSADVEAIATRTLDALYPGAVYGASVERVSTNSTLVAVDLVHNDRSLNAQAVALVVEAAIHVVTRAPAAR